MDNPSPTLSGPSFGPNSQGMPQKLVIMCHGLGADGNDLIGIAPYFAQIAPDTLFLSPNAPFPCDMAPFGYQWFSLQQRTEDAMLAGVREAQPILNTFIDQQLTKFKLVEKDVVLVGFSQGTMVSIFTALRRERPIAGIIGFSGHLVGKNVLANEIQSKPPILMINGDQDDLVPVETQPVAVQILTTLGIDIESHIRPGLGHSIDEVGIDIAKNFLERSFQPL